MLSLWHPHLQVVSLQTKQRLLQGLVLSWQRSRERQLRLVTGRERVLQAVCSAVEESGRWVGG